MTEEIKCGFVFSLTDGNVRQVEYVEMVSASGTSERAWGVDPVTHQANWMHGQYTVGKDLFLTAEEARAAALVARDKKIASLQKQMSKLQKMAFDQEVVLKGEDSK